MARQAQSSGAVRAVQVAIVLVFFSGVFAVIGANWIVDRFRRKQDHKGLSRT